MSDLINEHNIVYHFKKVVQLRDLEQASQLLMAAANNLKVENPYDYCFRALSCQMKQVDPRSDSYELLMRYVNASLASTKQKSYGH